MKVIAEIDTAVRSDITVRQLGQFGTLGCSWYSGFRRSCIKQRIAEVVYTTRARTCPNQMGVSKFTTVEVHHVTCESLI